MAELDFATLLTVIVVFGALVLLADARRLIGAEPLVWAFLRRRGTRRAALAARLGERGVRTAELRCAACPSRRACAARLAAGATIPVADCPNAALFARPDPRGATA
jgi:hypothetical protein